MDSCVLGFQRISRPFPVSRLFGLEVVFPLGLEASCAVAFRGRYQQRNPYMIRGRAHSSKSWTFDPGLKHKVQVFG